MTRPKQQSDAVMEFFETAPMDAVEVVLGLVKRVVERRRPGGKKPLPQAKPPAQAAAPASKAKAKPPAKKGTAAEPAGEAAGESTH
jgi:hypothetical protein